MSWLLASHRICRCLKAATNFYSLRSPYCVVMIRNMQSSDCSTAWLTWRCSATHDIYYIESSNRMACNPAILYDVMLPFNTTAGDASSSISSYILCWTARLTSRRSSRSPVSMLSVGVGLSNCWSSVGPMAYMSSFNDSLITSSPCTCLSFV